MIGFANSSYQAEAILTQKVNPKTGNREWVLVSKSKHRPLKYFGVKKPSEERVKKEERRIQYFKHVAGALQCNNIEVLNNQIKKEDLEKAVKIIKNSLI